MSLKTFLTIVFAAVLGLGLGQVFATSLTHRIWGAQPDALAIFMSQRWGVTMLGQAIVYWLIRDAGPSPTRRAVLIGGFLTSLFTAITSLIAVLSGVIGAGGWFAFVLEMLIAAGFAYYVFIRRQS